MSKSLVVSKHIDKLRRLRVLQTLAVVAPSPMGELSILRQLHTDVELSPTLETVRECIEYLWEWQLVVTIRDSDSPWMAAQISDLGIEWLQDASDRGFDIYSPGELPEPVQDNRRGRVSSIAVLPIEVKAWLDQELVKRSFSNYRGIAALLAERGYEISKSAIGRYGKRFKAEQQALKQTIEMAKAFAEVVGDDGAAMNQTLTALAQQELMAVMRDKTYIDEIKLPDLVRSIASLNRSDINTRKFQIQQEARQKALVDAAEVAASSAKHGGVSAETIEAIRRDVLGMS